MSRDIYDYLAELAAAARQRNPSSLERQAQGWAIELAGPQQAERIAAVSLAAYGQALKFSLEQAIAVATGSNTKAIYFEFDLDNDWGGNFFLCSEYVPLAEGNDDWACEYDDVVSGPDLAAFSEIYLENHFDQTGIAKGSTLYLVARTVAAFIRALEITEIPSDCAVCIAFHDQEPIMRLLGDRSVLMS